MILRRIACDARCTDAGECELRAGCTYAQMFEPAAATSSTGDRPSGLADWPRPFVFRATHLDGGNVRAGEQFHFDLNLFDVRTAAASHVARAFAQLTREGLGPRRSRVELISVMQLDEKGRAAMPFDSAPPLEISLERPVAPVSRLRVRFLTPTELKGGRQRAAAPEFGILAARIRDRISTLRELYDGGPLGIDFRAFGERAAAVRMTRCDLTQMEVVRRSSRTGQVHPLGGFIGEAEYEGDLAEFVPYLLAARWTGVGRQTVWGKGEVSVGL